MKKVLKVFTLILIIISMSSCFKKDELTNNNVYTTIYPIQYLTNYLYGEYKTVSSIYPNGADQSTYELTNKQKEVYSRGALFVYNGLSNEKELAREFLNSNKKMLLIDVSHSLKYENNIEELWLSPNNYLMLAKNIKNSLEEYTSSKVTKENIEKKYLELEQTLSYMDANLRNIAKTAKTEGSTTLIVSSNKLNFLNKYGFEIIDLSNEQTNITSIKNNFQNGNYKNIFMCSTDIKSELITDLETNYKATLINVNTLETLSDADVSNNENYETIMNNLIENIQTTALS